MTVAFDAIVIGGGPNGLVAAAALGRAGVRVALVERASQLGGQARVEAFAPGFSAPGDDGDSGWVPPTVVRGLGLGGLARHDPDPCVTVPIASGAWLTLWADPTRTAAAIARHAPADAARWPEFVRRVHRLAGFLARLYQGPPPDVDATGPGELGRLLRLGVALRRLGRDDMVALLRTLPMSVRELVEDAFEYEPLRAAVAAGGVRDLRQGPRSGGTGFVLLHYLVGAPAGAVRGRGRWRAGPDAFVAAVAAEAARRGVTIRSAVAARRILVRDDAVVGVMLADGTELAAPRVVSCVDPAHTLLDLLDPVWLDPEVLHAVRQIKFRGCTATVRYGMQRLPDAGADAEMLRGVVSCTPTLDGLERAADAAKYGAVAERPHVEITVPTLTWPALAPDGQHVAIARAQYAPYTLREGAWDHARREALGDAVTAVVDEALPGFSSRVVHREVLTPRDLADRYGLTEGARSHGELTLDQILFMRPISGWAHHALPVRGLYLGGAGAHPGPGIPGGAGWLAARRLLRDRRAGRYTLTTERS